MLTENFEYFQNNISDSTNGIILATGGYDNNILLWQAHTGSMLYSFNHPLFQVNKLKIHPIDNYLFSATRGEIRRYNLEIMTKDPDKIFDTGKGKNVTGVEIRKDGSWMASCGEDGYVRLWSLKGENTQIMSKFEKGHKFTMMRLHPNQVHLILGRDKSDILMWDIRNNQTLMINQNPELDKFKISQNICFTSFEIENQSSSLAITYLKNKSVLKLNMEFENDQIQTCWKENYVTDSGNGSIHGLNCSFSNDSTFLACCYSDGSTKVYRTHDGYKFITLIDEMCDDWVWDCVFTADSRYLITACADGTSRLWSLESGTKVREYIGHRSCVTSLAFRD